MADYHIYLHSDNQTDTSNVVPFSDRKAAIDDFTPTQNGDGSFEEAKSINMPGAAMLKKLTPWVSFGIASAVAVDKILTTGFNHLQEYTGRYEYALDINNVNTFVHNATHPISTFKSMIRKNFVYDKLNKEVEQNRALLGETIFSNKKVGV